MATQTQRTPAASSRPKTSGWLAFATIYLIIAGALNLIWGVTALSKKDFFNEDGLVWSNVQFWGWMALIVAAVQILTGLLIRARRSGGMIIGIVVGMVGALVNFVSIGAYPLWSGTAMVCSLLVLWAVTVHWEEL
jgi:hypothetical protein